MKGMDLLDKIPVEVERLITITPPGSPMGVQLPYSPRAKRVMELASEISFAFGHDVIDTSHLLLALLKENEGIAAQVLVRLGTKYDDLRDRTLMAYGASEPRPKKLVRCPHEKLEFNAGGFFISCAACHAIWMGVKEDLSPDLDRGWTGLTDADVRSRIDPAKEEATKKGKEEE